MGSASEKVRGLINYIREEEKKIWEMFLVCSEIYAKLLKVSQDDIEILGGRAQPRLV